MRWALAVLVVLAVGPWPSPASADAEVTGVVLRFTGPGGVKARAAVVRALRGRVDLVPSARVEARARALDADLGTAEGRARVAEALSLDVIVGGEVEGRGAAAVAHVRVYDASGEEVATRDARRPATSSGRRALTVAVRTMLREARERDREVDADVEEDHEEEPEEPPPSRARADAPPSHDEDARGDRDMDVDAGGDRRRREAESRTRPPYVRLLAGAGGRARIVHVPLVAGGARRYESGLFLDFPVRLDVRPLADRGAAAGFVVRADFAMAALIASSEPGTTNEIDTSAYRLGVHAGYEHAFEHGTFGAHAGFVYEAFVLAANPVLPSSRTPLIRAALGGSVDLVGPALGLRLEAAYRYLFGLGDLGTAFGTNADGMGLDVQLRLEGHFAAFAYSLYAGFEQSCLRFSGAAQDAPANRGTERGVALGAQAGFQL